VTHTPDPSPFAHPFVAAGALFRDEDDRVLLVQPTYKNGWDIPGGYVQPGESPRAACVREVREELGLTIDVGGLLVVDWAPADNEGDKILFVFDAGVPDIQIRDSIVLAIDELAAWRFVSRTDLDRYVPARLVRRLTTAFAALRSAGPNYAEHGAVTSSRPPRGTTPTG
jgi:8-oxo-dGTP pyrophosphatase MutT (NUDIX family)